MRILMFLFLIITIQSVPVSGQSNNVLYEETYVVPSLSELIVSFQASSNFGLNIIADGDGNFDFFVLDDSNYDKYILNEEAEIFQDFGRDSSFNEIIPNFPSDEYHFVFQNTGFISPVTIDLTLIKYVPPISFGDPIFLLGLIAIVGVVVLVYVLKFRKKSIYDLPKQAGVQKAYPMTSNLSQEHVQVFKKYWDCPQDKNVRLQTFTANPLFTVNKDNIERSIGNAIAVKKITPDLYDQTKELATILLDELNIFEITLVNTRCPKCRNFYVVPNM